MITKGIIIIPTHGFGNRLKMLASSVIYSKECDLSLFVCWQSTPDCNIPLSDIFAKENNINEISFDEVQKSKYCYFGQVHTNTLFDKITEVLDDVENTYEYILLEGGHEYKPANIPRLKYLQLKKNFYKSLLFTDDINSKLKAFRKKNNLDRTSKYIAIHYRDIDATHNTSDDQEDPIVNFVKNSPIEKFFEIVDKIKILHPIVVVSNTSEFYGHLKSKYSNKFNLCTTGVSRNNRDNRDDMIDSIVDFILLSQSELIIGSYFSSFSDEASFFKTIPKITPLHPELISNILQTVNNYHCLNYSFIDNIAAINFNDKILIETLQL